MDKFEYTIITLSFHLYPNTEELLAELNKYGAEGWEVVSTFSTGTLGYQNIEYRALLNRKIITKE
jgi:hypothetical protein